MASFTQQEITESALDWAILRDGGISLYRSHKFLESDTNALCEKGYRVVTIDCAAWSSTATMHESLARSLSFPSYYGHNLDALDECLCEDLEIPDSGGLLVRLLDFHTTQASDELSKSAASVLHIAARAIREHMLSGKRLIVLLQTNDPNASYERLGCINATWNQHEWLRNNRT